MPTGFQKKIDVATSNILYILEPTQASAHISSLSISLWGTMEHIMLKNTDFKLVSLTNYATDWLPNSTTQQSACLEVTHHHLFNCQ